MPSLLLATLTPDQKQLLRESFDTVLLDAANFADTFYTKLLRSSPAIRALLRGDMHSQAKKLLHLFWAVIYGLEHLAAGNAFGTSWRVAQRLWGKA